jgi:hypothetical protein
MAVYIGKYVDDFGNNYVFRELKVNLILETTLEINRGISSNTNYQFDLQYLPNIFLADFTLKTDRNQKTCPLDLTPRYVKYYLSNTEYLKVPIPYHPNTTEFNSYFSNLNSNVISVGYIGETLKSMRLSYANK